MGITLSGGNIEEYLKEDEVIDFGNENIIQLADALYQEADSEVEYIRKAYEFVLQSRTCWLLCCAINLFRQDSVIKS